MDIQQPDNNNIEDLPLKRSNNGDITWLLQSDENPSSEKDPNKWSWQAYSAEMCSAIERGILLNKRIIDFEDFYIDLTSMIQASKKDRNEVRRIKRGAIRNQPESRFMIDLPIPTNVLKEQKTVNRAFGNVKHFLNYIMKRTPEAYNLYQNLSKLQLDSSQAEYEYIKEEVINCIRKGAEARKSTVTAVATSQQANDFVFEGETIIEEITKQSTSLREFLNVILRIYTMETFICYWLNELLRSENWEEINVLTPYLVCLTYVFQLQDYVIKFEEPQGLAKMLSWMYIKPKIILYRGTALLEEHLDYYNPKKYTYFSWNCVTSTSKSKNGAIFFVKRSVNRAIKQNEKRIGVLFKIQADFGSISDCEGMIDISSYSKYPEEKEIILAPGTVFKILKARFIEDNIFKVGLEVKKEFKKDQREIALLGALQQKVIFKDRAILDGLSFDDIINALQLLESNQLIRKLEIRNISINSHLRGLIEDMRRTTPIKKEDVRLVYNTISIENLSALDYYYSLNNLSDILERNILKFEDEPQSGPGKQKDCKIKELTLRKLALQRYTKENEFENLLEKVKIEKEITRINVEIGNLEMSKFHQQKLLECIKSLPILQHLNLDFNSCVLPLDFFIINLGESLVSHPSIRELSLNFSSFEKISDSELSSLSIVLLQSVPLLEHLALSFKSVGEKVSDQVLSSFGTALQSLKFLKHLSFNFRSCEAISDEGLDSLCTALKSLPLLDYLDLNFRSCSIITDKGLGSISNALQSLQSLKHFALNFRSIEKISDSGFESLCAALKSLSLLNYLDVNFRACNEISDQGMNSIITALKSLQALQYLTLNFNSCSKISDEWLANVSPVLQSLSTLQHLDLNFRMCERISDQGLSNLSTALQSLSNLQLLALNFGYYYGISNQGLSCVSLALQSLPSLKHLVLNFCDCNQIFDQGLGSLSTALQALQSLQHLDLNFGTCPKIVDRGLNSLSIALQSLSSLQCLSLDFTSCVKISNLGLNDLSTAFKSTRSLRHLALNFAYCNKISDQGLSSVSAALQFLSCLERLTLHFKMCNQITLQGLNNITAALHSLPFLQYLSIKPEVK